MDVTYLEFHVEEQSMEDPARRRAARARAAPAQPAGAGATTVHARDPPVGVLTRLWRVEVDRRQVQQVAATVYSARLQSAAAARTPGDGSDVATSRSRSHTTALSRYLLSP